MNRFLTRFASPVSRRSGFLLALLAFVMTASPLVATLWLQVTSSTDGDYDYDTSNMVLGVTWGISYLGVVPLLFAIVALVRRPVTPSWLMPVSVALALCQPTFHVLNTAQVVMLDIGASLLMIMVTGSSIGVLVMGLRGVEKPAQIPLALLITVGASIAASAVLMVLTAALVSLVIAILLAVETRRHRKVVAALDVPTTESLA